MIILKNREQSDLIRALRILDRRMKLSNESSQYLYSQEKGLEGEVRFDSYVETYLSGECLVLNDLLLSIRSSTIQLDSVIITQDTVYLYEIKNYKGEYQINAGRLMTINGQEVNHPLTQLNKSLVKIRQLLDDLNIQMEVKGAVIFVEPTFYLFNVEYSKSYIFPAQIEIHFKTMQSKLKKLSKTHHFLAQKLLDHQINSAPYQKQVPVYSYSDLRKGTCCPGCTEMSLQFTQRNGWCKRCQRWYTKTEIILYNVNDYRFLFPELKVTSSNIVDWCAQEISGYQIRRTLNSHFKKIGTTSNCYYE